VDVVDIQHPDAGGILDFGEPLDEELRPTVGGSLVGDQRSGGPCVPLPFAGGSRSHQLDAGIELARGLGHGGPALDALLRREEVAGQGGVDIVVGAVPDFHLVVHSPIAETGGIQTQAAGSEPVTQDRRRGIRRPGLEVFVRIAHHQGDASSRGIEGSSACQVLSHSGPVVRLVVGPIVEIVVRVGGDPAQELETIDALDGGKLGLGFLGGEVPGLGVDVVVPIGVAGDLLAPVVLRAIVATTLARRPQARLAGEGECGSPWKDSPDCPTRRCRFFRRSQARWGYAPSPAGPLS
jgi:hypothetical protein